MWIEHQGNQQPRADCHNSTGPSDGSAGNDGTDPAHGGAGNDRTDPPDNRTGHDGPPARRRRLLIDDRAAATVWDALGGARPAPTAAS